jgi:hypothetical protein
MRVLSKKYRVAVDKLDKQNDLVWHADLYSDMISGTIYRILMEAESIEQMEKIRDNIWKILEKEYPNT